MIYWHQRVLVVRGLWRLIKARLCVVVRDRSRLEERLLVVKRLLGEDRILGVNLMLRGRDGLPCRLLLRSGVLLCGIARFSSPSLPLNIKFTPNILSSPNNLFTTSNLSSNLDLSRTTTHNLAFISLHKPLTTSTL